MAKPATEVDVLVLGAHPCADLAAALLRQNSSLRVTRASIPGGQLDDRLMHFNADLFDLHPLLATVKKKLELSPVYGLRFLSDDATISSEYEHKSIAAYVCALKQFRAAMESLAIEAGVLRVSNKTLSIDGLDENGVEVALDEKRLKPKLLIVADDLPDDARRVLALPRGWDAGVIHRYTYAKCKASRRIEFRGANAPAGSSDRSDQKQIVPMSLDLNGQLTWAWALHAGGVVQFAVEQPLESAKANRPRELLVHWLKVLESHSIIKSASAIDADKAISMDLPLAGALSQEGVGNRTLLIGPAGGFYTACAEDLYPACWSAVFAADAVKKALKEKHLQDALQLYRQKWGSTLGDYLRGPQQNLRFLLPLVYKNKVMTARLAEAILFGKSVVR